MKAESIFWLLMILWLIFGIGAGFIPADNPRARYFLVSGNLLVFVLFGLLGWHSFGPAIK